MARKTKEQAFETRECILQAALDMFEEQGVAKTSLENIAKKAGVTRGAIYWHFKNKKDIFHALHDDLHNSMMEHLRSVLAESPATPLEQLRKACLSVLLRVMTDPRQRQVVKIFMLRCDYSGDMAGFLQESCSQVSKDMSFFQKTLQDAQADGTLDPSLDIRALNLAINCFMGGIAHEYIRHPDLFQVPEDFERLVHLFFHRLIGQQPAST